VDDVEEVDEVEVEVRAAPDAPPLGLVDPQAAMRTAAAKAANPANAADGPSAVEVCGLIRPASSKSALGERPVSLIGRVHSLGRPGA